MSPTRWMQCWLFLLAAGLAGACWQNADAGAVFAAENGLWACVANSNLAPQPFQPAASANHRTIHVELLAAEEADDADGAGVRIKSVGKLLPAARPRPRILGRSCSSPPLWAYKAAFFPNTLHVRLQL